MPRFEALTVEALVGLGLAHDEALHVRQGLDRADPIRDDEARWARLSRDVLRPSHPFSVHEGAFQANYRKRDSCQAPAPAWIPQPEARSQTNLGRLLAKLGYASVEQFHEDSIRDREGFWSLMAETLPVAFAERGERTLDLSGGTESPNWFPGSRLNCVDSCFQANPEASAIVQHGEDGSRHTITYGELDRLSCRVAHGLRAMGLSIGDAVGLVLPLTIESVAALIGINRAGCAAIGIAESFAIPEVALRLRIGAAKLVITQDVLIRREDRLPLYPKVRDAAEIPVIVIPSDGEHAPVRPGDRSWFEFLGPDDPLPPVPCDPSDATVILFSSGTTGEPKAIPWDQTTPIKAAADGYLLHDIQPGDVVAWPSSMGWMMGPWLVYASLMNRSTIALYDGHPGTEGFCRFVQEAGVTQLGLVPSLVAAWKAGGWLGRYDWSKLKGFGSTGECSNPSDMLHLMASAGYRPVIEYCGGTEIGGGYITSTHLRPNAPACFNAIAFGIGLKILDEEGQPADKGESYLQGPSIGLSTRLLNRDHHATYFQGTPPGPSGDPLRRHGDRIERLPGGYYRVLGRVDDTMNLGGIKISAVEIERVLNLHPLVHESAAVTVHDESGGPERLVAYVVAAEPVPDTQVLRKELQGLVNSQLNPLFRVSEVAVVDALPRTASNKVMRRMLRPVSKGSAGQGTTSS